MGFQDFKLLTCTMTTPVLLQMDIKMLAWSVIILMYITIHDELICIMYVFYRVGLGLPVALTPHDLVGHGFAGISFSTWDFIW